MRFRSLQIAVVISLAAFPAKGLSDVNGVSLDGTRGFSRLTEASPETDIGARAAARLDYTRNSTLVYSNDFGSQLRRFGSLSIVPWRYIEIALQYRGLDSANDYVRPKKVKVRGDGLYSLKGSYDWGPISFGALMQARNYVAADGMALSGYALAQYDGGGWDAAVQVGWIAERPVVIQDKHSPVEAFAWQKANANALAARLAVSYKGPWLRPYLEYSTERYVAGGLLAQSPQRLALGSHIDTGLPGLAASPQIDAGFGGISTTLYPTEPPWRAGMGISYEMPVRKVFNLLFPPPGSFMAVVTDAARGNPVEHVRFYWNGRELEADASGRFRYDGPQGAYTVFLEAPGFLPVTDSVIVEPNQVVMKSFAMRRNAGTVRGIVFLGPNQPGRAYLKVPESAVVFESDPATGAFGFELPPDAYSMMVSAPGYLPEKRSFVLKLGKEVVFDRLELKPEPRAIAIALTPEPVAAPPPPAPVAAIPEPEPVAALPVVKPPKVPVLADEDEEEEPPVRKKKRRPADEEEDQESERRNWLPLDSGALPDSLESPVFFQFGSSRIDPRAFPALDRLAAMLREDASIARVVIEGRADAIGRENVNWIIAGKRADAVYQYLVKKDVGDGKLATTSTVYRKRAQGQTSEQRAIDRRVGFRLERK